MKRQSIMIPKPRSAFLSVQCKCGEKAVVFSHTTRDISCKSCGQLLIQKSASKAKVLSKVLGSMDQ